MKWPHIAVGYYFQSKQHPAYNTPTCTHMLWPLPMTLLNYPFLSTFQSRKSEIPLWELFYRVIEITSINSPIKNSLSFKTQFYTTNYNSWVLRYGNRASFLLQLEQSKHSSLWFSIKINIRRSKNAKKLGTECSNEQGYKISFKFALGNRYLSFICVSNGLSMIKVETQQWSLLTT